MSVDGIRTAETCGPFEWERAGVLVFENGSVIGGDDRQYAPGSYSVSEGQLKAELLNRHYGPPRIVFGKADEEFRVKIAGTREGGRIHGLIRRTDRPRFDLHNRLTRRKAVAGQSDRQPGEAPAGTMAPANGSRHDAFGSALAAASPPHGLSCQPGSHGKDRAPGPPCLAACRRPAARRGLASRAPSVKLAESARAPKPAERAPRCDSPSSWNG